MAKRKPLPSRECLTELFNYNSKTGSLTRKTTGKEADFIAISGYGRLCIDGQLYFTHRIIWKLIHGYDPVDIDHINGIRSDNRISNLRDVSARENNRNIGLSRRNTSGYTGVVFCKRLKQWRVFIAVDKKKIAGGCYKSKIDAVLAFNKLALELHGELAARRVEFNLKKLEEEYGEIHERKTTLQITTFRAP
ncbi:HNH endonuclease [Hafnia alvei]|uniref:HNH endonuclease n=1 Tax=Hafnia alvei TaxID=569 RepID=UPI00165E60C5|nr:HNH endonuclease [Hafnia alvei]